VQYPGNQQEEETGEVVTKRRGRHSGRAARKRRGNPAPEGNETARKRRDAAPHGDSGMGTDGEAIFEQPQESTTKRAARPTARWGERGRGGRKKQSHGRGGSEDDRRGEWE
jgi:hypothetical protein